MTDPEWNELLAEAKRLRVEIVGKLDALGAELADLRAQLNGTLAEIKAQGEVIADLARQLGSPKVRP